MKRLATVGVLLLIALAHGCANTGTHPYSFVPTGKDRLTLSATDAGFAYHDSRGNLRLELMDPDHDGSADYLRIYALDSSGCSVMVEDYETDGTLDLRMTTCRQRDEKKVELNVEGTWIRLEKGEGGPTVVVKGVRRRVLQAPHGWLRVGDAV